jgi:hypothetical protein
MSVNYNEPSGFANMCHHGFGVGMVCPNCADLARNRHFRDEEIERLRADVNKLRGALSYCAQVLSGDRMSKSELVRGLELAKDALESTKESQP